MPSIFRKILLAISSSLVAYDVAFPSTVTRCRLVGWSRFPLGPFEQQRGVFLDLARDSTDVGHHFLDLILDGREFFDQLRQLLENGGESAFFRGNFRDLTLAYGGKQRWRAGVTAVQLDEDDSGDTLQLQRGPGIGLDGHLFAQADVHLHQARISRIEGDGLDRPDIDAVKLHRIANREPAY